MPEPDSPPVAETVEPDQLQPSGEPLSVRSGAFRALRHRNYRLYFFGQLVSLAGTWMQSAAQAWLVLKLTNSSMMLGVVSFAQFTPILLVGLFAGVLIDRVDRRRLIITTQFMLMMSAFTLAALTWTGAVRVEHVIMLAAFNGAIGSFDMPGRQSIWSLFQMEIPARVITGVGTRMFQQLREGLAYVWTNRAIFHQMALAAVTNGFGYQYLVLVPIFARNVLHGDARTYGFLVAIQGLGSVLGAATLASRTTTRGIRNNLIGGLFISAIGIIVFGLSRWMLLSMLAQLVIGAGLTNFRASNNTLVQLFVSDDLRGRVMSTYQLAAVGMTPLGALEVGYMGTRLGPVPAVVLCGAITMVSGLVLLTRLKSVGKSES